MTARKSPRSRRGDRSQWRNGMMKSGGEVEAIIAIGVRIGWVLCQVLVGKRRSPAGLLGDAGLEPYFMYRYPHEMSPLLWT
jgi:hypothetical protein